MRMLRIFICILFIFFSFGCDRCANLDCLYDQSFIFRLTNQQGENLLDKGSISSKAITIYTAENPVDSLYISTFLQENQTWIEARLKKNINEYTLQVKNEGSYQLKFDLTNRSTECCGTITEINEVYLDEKPAEAGSGKWKNIVLP
jgi:hypothetical protein